MKETDLSEFMIPKTARRNFSDSGGFETRWDLAALLGLSGAISFGVLGLFLFCVASFSAGEGVPEIYRLATAFIFMVFPFALIGAYALRKSEKTS